MTSMTTLLVLIALFFLGGELIHGFATTLIIGVVIGTYSSIYVASTCTLWLGVQKADLMPVQKEGPKSSMHAPERRPGSRRAFAHGFAAIFCTIDQDIATYAFSAVGRAGSIDRGPAPNTRTVR